MGARSPLDQITNHRSGGHSGRARIRQPCSKELRTVLLEPGRGQHQCVPDRLITLPTRAHVTKARTIDLGRGEPTMVAVGRGRPADEQDG